MLIAYLHKLPKGLRRKVLRWGEDGEAAQPETCVKLPGMSARPSGGPQRQAHALFGFLFYTTLLDCGMILFISPFPYEFIENKY